MHHLALEEKRARTLESEPLPRAVVEFLHDCCSLRWFDEVEIEVLGEILPEKSVGVLV